MNTTNSQVPNYSTNHEYVLVYAKNLAMAAQDASMFREPKPGYDEVMAVVRERQPNYPTIVEVETAIRGAYRQHRDDFREEVETQGLNWKQEARNDPWRGIYPYNRAEYRDD